MAISHSIQFSFNGRADATFTIAPTAEQENNIDTSIPASTTDQLVPFTIPTLNKLRSLFIVSDGALTLEFDDGTTPEQTITLAADTPVVWVYGGGVTNIVSSALTTGIYCTNAGSSAVRLRIWASYDN